MNVENQKDIDKMYDNYGLKIGVVFGVISFILTSTYLFPLLTLFPAIIIEFFF